MAVIFAPGATGSGVPELGTAKLTAAVLAPTTTELATIARVPTRQLAARQLTLAIGLLAGLLLALRRRLSRSTTLRWIDVVAFDVPFRRGPPLLLA